MKRFNFEVMFEVDKLKIIETFGMRLDEIEIHLIIIFDEFSAYLFIYSTYGNESHFSKNLLI